MFTQGGLSDRRDRCGLCGKKKSQVPKLIVGLQSAVCSDCIDLCNDIIANESFPKNQPPPPSRYPAPDPMESSLQSAISNLLIRVYCPECKAHNLADSKYCCQCAAEMKDESPR